MKHKSNKFASEMLTIRFWVALFSQNISIEYGFGFDFGCRECLCCWLACAGSQRLVEILVMIALTIKA